ncbi:helix-turn-helix domain-containing protein [Shewanella sp. 202IG2-18]|uniref:helix-turn-helix domain-containing protein n=1 Tax=Parashewanella hymeniacidonis TaxID=2807618 RepID=UPI001961D0B6|nr:helix-turn-helix domain-containing protein [Parashewanella hymeniacidonis]MBM7074018.1 helix-turn-helix domain-containing protein [Parashewanella hymeniacidonis]
MSSIVKLKNMKFLRSLNLAVNADGGKEIVERLIGLFCVRNRLELAEVLGTHPGTFSTWQTRNTTPFEMLTRIHLATGVSMEYLCFGKGELPDIFQNTEWTSKDTPVNQPPQPTQTAVDNQLCIYALNNGKLVKTEEFPVDPKFHTLVGIASNDFALEHSDGLLFINTQQNVVTKGTYLFSVNGAHQVGELRQLPDGKIYFYDEGEKYLVDTGATEVKGRVVKVLGER